MAGLVIEIWVNSPDEFEEALLLLDRLGDIARVSEARKKIQHIWEIENNRRIMNEIVHASDERVAISLFMEWPQPRGLSDVAWETGLSSGAVSNLMTGRRRGNPNWFKRESEGWTLSNEGLSFVIDKIIPLLSGEEKSEPLY